MSLLHSLCCPVRSAATEVVTVFVFQEPSLLSSLQDNGLTDVMLHALLIKDVSPPALCRSFLSLSPSGFSDGSLSLSCPLLNKFFHAFLFSLELDPAQPDVLPFAGV